jgi:hypothetical protein
MENICEEFEFVCANYYALKQTKEGDILTAKGEPFVMLNDDETSLIFRKASEDMKRTKGKGIIGRVWESEGYEWQRNI